jgi:hypothetical protein
MKRLLRNNALLGVTFFALWFLLNLFDGSIPWQVAVFSVLVLFMASFAISFHPARRVVQAVVCALVCTTVTVVGSMVILIAIFGLKGWH